ALAAALARHRPRAVFPAGAFGAALRTAAALVHGAPTARVVSVELPGFDTHCDQPRRHGQRLAILDAGLSALLADLGASARGRAAVVLVFSELGRTLEENPARGTGHGRAGPVLIAGGLVRGGFYGAPPSLAALDRGALVPTTDFRSVYATVIASLFAVDLAAVLGGTYPRLGFLPAQC
ncbi:MAG: DUF1501 domain-containing protein, partial [Planctomycetota bacterium]